MSFQGLKFLIGQYVILGRNERIFLQTNHLKFGHRTGWSCITKSIEMPFRFSFTTNISSQLEDRTARTAGQHSKSIFPSLNSEADNQ